jgi:hypothetical protein
LKLPALVVIVLLLLALIGEIGWSSKYLVAHGKEGFQKLREGHMTGKVS